MVLEALVPVLAHVEKLLQGGRSLIPLLLPGAGDPGSQRKARQQPNITGTDGKRPPQCTPGLTNCHRSA